MTNVQGRNWNWKPSLLSLSLIVLLSLSGCTTVDLAGDQANTQVAEVEEEVVTTGSREATESDEATLDLPPPPLRPFEPETLFDLLVADIAGGRQQYGLQLNRYRKQAFTTRDPGLAAQATALAMRLNAAPQALELAQLWVSLAPEDIDANRIAAHYLSHALNFPKALPLALFALKKDDTEAINTFASLLGRTDEKMQRALLEQIRELTGESAEYYDVANRPEVLLIKVELLRMLGNYEQAITEASRIQQPESSRESGLLAIAQVILQRDGPEAAIQSLEESLLLMPNSKRLRLQLARQWAEKDLNRSREELGKLASQFPEDHRLIYALASINKRLGFLDEAKSLFTQLLDTPTYKLNAHFELAQILDQQEDKERAIEHYKQAQSGENAAPAIRRLIQLLADTDNEPEIRATLQRLLEQQANNDVGVYRLVADSLARGQHMELAIKFLGEALDNHPNNIELLYDRSLMAEQSGDTESSHRDLRAIIELDPKHSAALNALGYSLCNHSDQYQEAYELISRALELDPNNYAILDSLGWALFRLNRYEEALPHLRRALEMNADPEIAAHLGEVLWVMGSKEEALEVWNKNLAEKPGPSYVTKTMKRLGVPQTADSGTGK